MSQHTPGPWAFVDHSWCDKSVYASLHQTDEKRICALHLDEDASEDEETTEIANGRLIAAAPDLLAALAGLEVLYLREGEGWNECFERVAELFHKDTGYLRPGKDSAAAANEDREERERAWNAWLIKKSDAMRAALRKATGAQS